MKSATRIVRFSSLAVAILALAAWPADLRRIDVADSADMAIAGCKLAIPDDGVSDLEAFTCALGFLGGKGNCAEAKRGVLHVPSGTFDFEGGLEVNCGVQVVGNGYSSVLNQLPGGVWVSTPFITLRDQTILRDVKLDQFQPESGPFQKNQFSIQCQGDDILVENIMLFKTFQGIAIGGLGWGVGRVTLRNIRGQPLAMGILIDNVLDVVRIEDVHFWPFWSLSTYVADFTRKRGVGIRTARNDNPFLGRLFFYGYNVGVEFVTSSWPDPGVSGSTSKAKISGMDCDFCSVGVWMNGSESPDNVVTAFSYLANGIGMNAALLVSGDGNKISVSEANVDQLPTSAVQVSGNGNFVRVSQWYVRRWNVSGSGDAAFVDYGSGNQVWVRDSFGRWPNGGGTCSATASCEFVLGQPL